MTSGQNWTAFLGTRCIAAGAREMVARAVKQAHDEGVDRPVIIIDDATGRQLDLDLRGSADDVVSRIAQDADTHVDTAPRGRGRPRLGVTAREITLLPRHWDWLDQQPGGASGSLRRLIDEARTSRPYVRRQAQAVTDRFMTVFAGDLPHFEDATRALYAGEAAQFEGLIADWPHDIRVHTRRLASAAFEEEDGDA
ncbi:DUF2239 family protein [Sphingopyxis sp. JAI128]|uniref:DUF2239 family protein n=1 Tax=Sphingopyxis sp. JAI128 TaxID=2723066 RepID=UPI00160B4431|nr:DUF2239 family protein [Sphingopyxis sp. JAI128]MBB6426905.1 hypothetical protein [Sphingopyxis sp. JAI128]